MKSVSADWQGLLWRSSEGIAEHGVWGTRQPPRPHSKGPLHDDSCSYAAPRCRRLGGRRASWPPSSFPASPLTRARRARSSSPTSRSTPSVKSVGHGKVKFVVANKAATEHELVVIKTSKKASALPVKRRSRLREGFCRRGRARRSQDQEPDVEPQEGPLRPDLQHQGPLQGRHAHRPERSVSNDNLAVHPWVDRAVIRERAGPGEAQGVGPGLLRLAVLGREGDVVRRVAVLPDPLD